MCQKCLVVNLARSLHELSLHKRKSLHCNALYVLPVRGRKDSHEDCSCTKSLRKCLQWSFLQQQHKEQKPFYRLFVMSHLFILSLTAVAEVLKAEPLSWQTAPPTNVINTTTYLCARKIVWVCLDSCYNLTQNYAIGEHIRLRERKKLIDTWFSYEYSAFLSVTEFLLTPNGYHETTKQHHSLTTLSNCIRANIFHGKKHIFTESSLDAQIAMITLKFFQEKKKEKTHQIILNPAM